MVLEVLAFRDCWLQPKLLGIYTCLINTSLLEDNLCAQWRKPRATASGETIIQYLLAQRQARVCRLPGLVTDKAVSSFFYSLIYCSYGIPGGRTTTVQGVTGPWAKTSWLWAVLSLSPQKVRVSNERPPSNCHWGLVPITSYSTHSRVGVERPGQPVWTYWVLFGINTPFRLW